ncbi:MULTISPECIES: contact-dependent growth inhibition system immunity protein [Proteus]|nr:contact-dependent growth inhibition system immunity protein [Proteus sp. G2664]EEG84054.1 hypothetical protein PROPEN_04826 [Proteus penneri ATCC 35198]NBM32828.1 CdiI family contact-dependent growth inhibition immunity protein [Proteus sp. G2664]
MMTFINDNEYCALIVMTDKFFCLNTESGYGLMTIDPNFSSIILSLTCSNKKLGESLIKVLENSRTQLKDEEYDKLFKKENIKKNWNSWLELLRYKYDYRSKRQLLANMLNCSIYLSNNKILILPSYHSSLEGWEGIGASHKVILSLDSSFDEIGSGIRLAFSRCTTKKF